MDSHDCSSTITWAVPEARADGYRLDHECVKDRSSQDRQAQIMKNNCHNYCK